MTVVPIMVRKTQQASWLVADRPRVGYWFVSDCTEYGLPSSGLAIHSRQRGKKDVRCEGWLEKTTTNTNCRNVTATVAISRVSAAPE